MLGQANAVAALAKSLSVGKAAVKADLESLVEDLDRPGLDLPAGLARQLASAETLEDLEKAIVSVRDAFLAGTLDDRRHATLLASLKLQMNSILKRPVEVSDRVHEAVEILTPQETAAVEAYRRSVAPVALKPGEMPPPPPTEDEA